MSLSGSDEMGINVALFKLLRFYHILDPDSGKLFNRNAYRLAWVAVNVVTVCVVALSAAGLSAEREAHGADLELMQLLFFYMIYCGFLLKSATLIRRGDDLWRTLDVTRERFLVSDRCREHVAMFHERRVKSMRATNVLCACGFVAGFQWLVFPLLVNATLADDPGRRYENVFNLPFAVSTRAYNDHYALFYAVEVSVSACIAYVLVTFDVFIISLCYAFVVDYEIIAMSMERLGSAGRDGDQHASDERNQHSQMIICYDDFRSIIVDLQNIYLKLKSFYDIVWIITLSYVILHSALIISLTYSFVMVFLSSGSVPILRTIKLFSAFVYLLFVLFYLSYLVENINIKKESIQFSMYCCNWTAMNLKLKRQLILGMCMEHANKMMIKITPKKIINLQLFTSVMLTCYNIISFMLNARPK